MRWYNSLIFKIILCCVVLTFCLIGSIFGVLYRYQQSILAEMEQKSSEILQQFYVGLSSLEVEETSEDILKSRLSDLKERHDVDAIILYDSKRNLVSRIQSDEIPLLEFGDPNNPRVMEVTETGGRKITAYFQTFPLLVGSRTVGYVKIALAISPQTHLVKTFQSKIVIALLLLFLGTIGALCYFIFKILQPLHSMATTCHEIGEGNIHEIDIKPNASEVLMLEMKFNEMVLALKAKAEMEQKLVQAQRLSAIGNLAAGVAHEIGNPLNGIKLTISHLKDISSRHEFDESSFNAYADTILSEVNRLDQIVRDFLTLAKERELSLRPYGVDKLLEEALRLIEKEAQKRGISIRTNISAETIEAMIDPQLLKGALLNILINAMEASAERGIILVDLAETDGQVVVRIADEGKGIPDDIINRVFDPYFSTKSAGTGLGLPLTKTLVEKHGGEIVLESRQGEGTTVTITIPIGDK